jgi:hypothetical protein
MNTTINTGWTLDKIKPATRQQLVQLKNALFSFRDCDERNNAIAALDNAIDCLENYRNFLDWRAEAEMQAADWSDELATQQSALGTLA